MKRFFATILFLMLVFGAARFHFAHAVDQPSAEKVTSLLASMLTWFKSIDGWLSDHLGFSSIGSFFKSVFTLVIKLLRELADIIEWVGDKAGQYYGAVKQWWRF